MPVSMRIEGDDRIKLRLQTRAKIAKGWNGQCSVVYGAPYAVFVHENLKAFHRRGQAKYLEQPARVFRRQMGDMIKADVKRGIPLPKAIYRACVFLKVESQKLVPVDTGYLRDSAAVEAEFTDFVVQGLPSPTRKTITPGPLPARLRPKTK